MADWATISSLATAGGTLVLAIATFGSVRSANRAARISELALQENRRPVLVNATPDDRSERIEFTDGHWLVVPGGQVAVDISDDGAYMAASLRNVGAGLAVLQCWRVHEVVRSIPNEPPPGEELFRRQIRDIYVASSDTGLWQGALRDPSDPDLAFVRRVVGAREAFMLELMYTDQIGGQRTVSRFGVLPAADDDSWLLAAARHWFLDAPGPR